jgi:hypothetical protein
MHCLCCAIQPTDGNGWHIIDITIQDGGGAKPAVAKGARGTLNWASIPGNNYGRFPMAFQVTPQEYEDESVSFDYQEQAWTSTDAQCTGGKDEWKGGKRNIRCKFECI